MLFLCLAFSITWFFDFFFIFIRRNKSQNGEFYQRNKFSDGVDISASLSQETLYVEVKHSGASDALY